jgi:hypothetical protein
MPDIFSEILKFIGGVAAVGAATTACAYAIFRVLATKWIETRFSERLEQFKHQQNQEIEHLRFRINTMMDRTVKLHQREFEVLPDTWSLLTDSFFTIEPVAIGFQQYPDLNNMSPERLDEFLDEGPLTPVQKTELKGQSDKIKYYSDVKGGHDLNKASDAYNEFRAKFVKNGIFIPDPIKSKFAAIDDMLKQAIIERQVQPHKFDKGVALHDKGRALLAEFGRDIQSRSGVPTRTAADKKEAARRCVRGATLHELADSYDRSIATMRRIRRAHLTPTTVRLGKTLHVLSRLAPPYSLEL